MNISKRELTCLVDSLRDFLKTFDQSSNCIQYPLPEPKVEIGSTKSKDNLFADYYNDIIEHPKRQIGLSFRFGKKTNFHLNHLNYTVVNFFLQKLSTLTIAKFTISTRTDITLQTSVKYLRSITMCSAFTPDCGYDNSLIILTGDVYSPKTKCLSKHCLQKKTLQSLGRSDYQCPQCASVCQVRNIPFEDQTKSFFLSLGQGVYIFEETPKPIQDVLGDVYCPGKDCSNGEKCESLDGYPTTTRFNYGLENLEPGCLFTKFLFCCKST